MKISEYFKLYKKLLFLILIAILIILPSCSDITENPIESSSPDPLFNHTDLNKLSIYSGNMHFGGFLTSDSSYIYFHSKDNTGLIRADYNGENQIVLSNKLPGYITTVGDMVYFTDGISGGNIYKVNIEGKGESIASSVNSVYVISQFDFIYYIDFDNKHSYKVNHDGSNVTEIIEYSTDEIIIFDQYIYFLVNDMSVSEKSLIFKIKLEYIRNLKEPVSYPLADISDDIKVYEINSKVRNINVSENYIFYLQNETIYKINKEDQKIFNTKIKTSSPFIVSDGNIYYINKNDNFRIFRSDIEKFTDKKMVVNDMVEEFVICGNSIYYRRSRNNEIYRASVQGGISSKIT